MKKLTFIFTWLFLILNFIAYPQNRGKYSFGDLPAPPLNQNITNPAGVPSSGGLGGVGGVSFDKVAHPATDLQILTIDFSFDPLQPDGNRFQLEINNQKVTAPLFDWMLIPIARYANSGHNSCFTYFGQLSDRVAEEFILENEGHILNYHPDFFNTLLGSRLGDIDLLLMYQFVIEPPKQNGRFILGAGEATPDLTGNKIGYFALQTRVNEAISLTGQSYRSYLISDYNQDIAFTVNQDTLKIAGSPYYYCWRYVYDKPSFNQDKKASEVEAQTYTQIAEKINKGQTKRQAVIDFLLESSGEYEVEFDFISAGTVVDLINLPEVGNQRRELLEKYTTESLLHALIDLRANMAFYTVEFLEKLSDRISKPTLFNSANPLVWNATVQTLRYSAFFRYLKKHYPAKWNSFITSINDVKVEPAINTPTVLYSSDNKKVKNFVKNKE